MSNRLPNFTYEIVKHCGTISDTGSQSKELNIVSYNGHDPKFDLRIWVRDRENPSKKVMGKGITMTTEELIFLRDAIDELNLEEEEPLQQDKGFNTSGFGAGGFFPSGGFDSTGSFG